MFANAAFFAVLAVGSALGATVDYNFEISYVNASPDGFQRSVVAVNGLIPGTLVTMSFPCVSRGCNLTVHSTG
jgi:hypothetical protein